MRIFMTFKVCWNKAGKETLPQFKERYDKFKAHIYNLQAKGHLPVEADIIWVVGREVEDGGTQGVIDISPTVAHVNGEELLD